MNAHECLGYVVVADLVHGQTPPHESFSGSRCHPTPQFAGAEAHQIAIQLAMDGKGAAFDLGTQQGLPAMLAMTQDGAVWVVRTEPANPCDHRPETADTSID